MSLTFRFEHWIKSQRLPKELVTYVMSVLNLLSEHTRDFGGWEEMGHHGWQNFNEIIVKRIRELEHPSYCDKQPSIY